MWRAISPEKFLGSFSIDRESARQPVWGTNTGCIHPTAPRIAVRFLQSWRVICWRVAVRRGVDSALGLPRGVRTRYSSIVVRASAPRSWEPRMEQQ